MLINKSRTVFIAGTRIDNIQNQPESGLIIHKIFLNTMKAIQSLKKQGYTDFVFELKDGFNMMTAEAVLIDNAINHHNRLKPKMVAYMKEQLVMYQISEISELRMYFYSFDHVQSSAGAQKLIQNCSHLLCYCNETQDMLPEIAMAAKYGITVTNMFDKRL